MSKLVPSCGICTESYNKSNRKEVGCPTCNFSACRICYTTYWNNSLSPTNSKLRCISGQCNYLFDISDMIEKKTFTLKDIKHLQDLLRSMAVDEEDLQALSAITDEQIERVKEALYCRRMVDVITAEIEERGEPVRYSAQGYLKGVSPATRFLYHLRKSYKDISSYLRPGGLAHMDRFLSENRQYITDYMTPELYTKLVLYDGQTAPSDGDNEQPPEADIPVANCSMNDCRGFIRTKGFKCNICSTKFCNKCMSVKDDNHQCKEDDISSFKMIKSECKPCPSCKALIYKIDGCNDMFCVVCKTPFSWRSGKVINGRFHNPHHAEWIASMRDQHSVNGTVDQCDYNRLYRMNICQYHGVINEYVNHVMHLRNSILPHYETDNDDKVLEQRIMYLLGIISKEAYNDKMKKMKKSMDYNKEIFNLIVSYTDIMISLFDILEQSPNRISAKLKQNAIEEGYPVIHNDKVGYTYEMFKDDVERFIEEFMNTNTLINKKYDSHRDNLFKSISKTLWIIDVYNLKSDPQLVDLKAWNEMKKPTRTMKVNKHPYLRYTDDEYRKMILELRENKTLSNIPWLDVDDQEKEYIQVLYLMDKYEIGEYEAGELRRHAKCNGTMRQILYDQDSEEE